MITLEHLREKIQAAGAKVVAIEAQWDGDTGGWFLEMFAILDRASSHHPRYDSLWLCGLSEAGDIRLFEGAVPPWPEAAYATELGEALAAELGVPFYFPSPTIPEDQCARWWDRDHTHRCDGCDVALQPGPRGRPWPWPNACAACIARVKASGGVSVYVRVAAAVPDVPSFEEQRDAWRERIVGGKLGLIELVNVLTDAKLWLMLAVYERDAGLAAVLAHLRETGQLGRATVSVQTRGNPVRVWPKWSLRST